MSPPSLSRVFVCVVSLAVGAACRTSHSPPPTPPEETPCRASLAGPAATREKFITVARKVPGEYVVVLAEPARGLSAQEVSASVAQLSARHGGTPFQVYASALRGFASRMTEAQARAMAAAPEVALVQENGVLRLEETQTGATWGIDRMDQRDLPLDQHYLYRRSGRGVHVYLLDTGIRPTHREFGGRADAPFDSAEVGGKGIDCHGHGTHVAATVGGRVYGMAKDAQLHAVRVLGCTGGGTTAGVVAGVDWVAAHHQSPAVANMSLGGPVDAVLDEAVRRAVRSGVTFVVAAGNESEDACLHSPARVDEVLSVGATNVGDARASFSNYGQCVDLFAPGEGIVSAWMTDDSATQVLSGTSMASPHVTGAVALYLEANPTASPEAVARALVDNATPDKVSHAGRCSPTRMAFSGFISPVQPTVRQGAE
ncbi:S8 family peptidase [Corallococcus sp. H22C18031201]|uniref:S8 family peptidase n=1 Tax=Citreicoccus inhibens TaxID=2849499 RepID=UPI000E72E35F|nr:S8 family peptidase [Citreicoccus inhibens]MBU8895114.1 S8 family peptidase [Citreicoccus inhibens]RJS27260.1 S8 family peptidase [Corallococcus sp. H22C18031201]